MQNKRVNVLLQERMRGIPGTYVYVVALIIGRGFDSLEGYLEHSRPSHVASLQFGNYLL